MKEAVITEDLTFISQAALPWEQLAGKIVLITGANGFLPAYLVETLLFLNDHRGLQIQIIGVVRNLERATTRFAAYAGRDDIRFLVQDISTPLQIEGPLDVIIHAASQASPKYYGSDPVGTLAPNVIGTHHLLELAREKRVSSFLYFSSSEIYGAVPHALLPTSEQDFGIVDPSQVRSCYAESKRMGETLCISYHHQYGVPVTIVRPFHTYGPGMQLDDGRVFADFVSNIVNREHIVMKSDGTATRAFCYIADATVGFFTVLFQGQAGQAYNVGFPEEMSILQLAHLLVSLFPELGLQVVTQPETKSAGYIQSQVSRSCPDITRMRQIGWEPQHSVAIGFARTIRSFQCPTP